LKEKFTAVLTFQLLPSDASAFILVWIPAGISTLITFAMFAAVLENRKAIRENRLLSRHL